MLSLIEYLELDSTKVLADLLYLKLDFDRRQIVVDILVEIARWHCSHMHFGLDI